MLLLLRYGEYDRAAEVIDGPDEAAADKHQFACVQFNFFFTFFYSSCMVTNTCIFNCVSASEL